MPIAREPGDGLPALSGRCLEAPGEHWASLISAIREGHRGLPGGTTFAQLLIKLRGYRSKGYAPPLSIPQILARGGCLPHQKPEMADGAVRVCRRSRFTVGCAMNSWKVEFDTVTDAQMRASSSLPIRRR